MFWYPANMRLDTSFENVEKNHNELAPLFTQRVAPALAIFVFLLSLAFADLMNLSLLFGVEMGLLIAPVAYFMGVSFFLFGKCWIDITRPAVLPIFVLDVKYVTRQLFPSSVVLPHPVSPPRHCLADCEALKTAG